MTVETPAADLVAADDILDEEDAVAEAKAELIEQLDVLEEVVVAGPGVAVLVVVPVDEQLDDRLHVVCTDESLLLPLACDQGDTTDGHHVRALPQEDT